MKALRIVFMGTPDFAVGILDAILQANYTVAGVITAPDKPAGRGQKLSVSAVKTYASAKQLTLLQPTNLKDESFLKELSALNANLFIVVAFRMLPKHVWQMPELGTFNLHASLLPQYRGAAPINWAIINGETKTGVSTFFIDDKIDTGEVILQDELAIEANENAGILHDRLMNLGAKTVLNTLQQIATETVKTTIQTDSPELKSAYKLNKENCKIDWQKPATEIHNLIRGLSPYPAAWSYFKDDTQEWAVKIYEATAVTEAHEYSIGKIITTKTTLKIAITGGFIEVINLQFPGKKRMSTKDLLNGVQFSENTFAH